MDSLKLPTQGKIIAKDLLNTDSFFILGARGVGKSTFVVQQFLKDSPSSAVWIIDLLNDDTFDRYLRRTAMIEDDYKAFSLSPL